MVVALEKEDVGNELVGRAQLCRRRSNHPSVLVEN